MAAAARLLRLLMSVTLMAEFRILCVAVKAMAASTMMMVTTTSSSTRVKPGGGETEC